MHQHRVQHVKTSGDDYIVDIVTLNNWYLQIVIHGGPLLSDMALEEICDDMSIAFKALKNKV
jgi:hypothetical protein